MQLDSSSHEPDSVAAGDIQTPPTRLPDGYTSVEFDQVISRISEKLWPAGATLLEATRLRDALIHALPAPKEPLPDLLVPDSLVALHEQATRAWGLRGADGVVVGGPMREQRDSSETQSQIAIFEIGVGMTREERDANARFCIESVRHVRALIDRQRPRK